MKSMIFNNNEVDYWGDDVMNKELLLFFSNDDLDDEQNIQVFPNKYFKVAVTTVAVCRNLNIGNRQLVQGFFVITF